MSTRPTEYRRPRIAITAGEPAGIGPELVAQLACINHDADLIVIADPHLIEQRARDIGKPIEWQIFDPASAAAKRGVLNLIPIALRAPSIAGQLDLRNSAYVLQTLARAADGAMSGEFDAIVTAPLHKSVINDAGIPFTGHTEFFADRAHCNVVMMLATEHLRVALATTHLALAAVPAAITDSSLLQSLRILHRDLISRFAIAEPRIAVLGLNPHAGEGGYLGREEIDTIIPVIEQLRAEGMNLSDPLPADTAFVPMHLAHFDAVFAMYHDQGLPVLKHAGFGRAVNITLGLPYVRTSVDHGTALDLAGSGKADAGSLVAATTLAIQLASSSN